MNKWLFLLISFLITNMALADDSLPGLRCEVRPLRAQYHMGEPLAVSVVLKNESGKNMYQLVSDHSSIGTTQFTCEGAGILTNLNSTYDFDKTSAQVFDWRRSVFFQGGTVFLTEFLDVDKEIAQVVVLNRFFMFTKPGKYKVKYEATCYSAWPFEIPGGKFHEAGFFEVTVLEQDPDEKWTKSLLRHWQLSKPQANDKPDESAKTTITDAAGKLAKPVAELMKPNSEDLTEMLLWSQSPLVIEPLVNGIVTGKIPKKRVDDVLESLGKFFVDYEQARTGILEIARRGDSKAFQAAISIYSKKERVIPVAWFKQFLQSDDSEKVVSAIRFIGWYGSGDDIKSIEPLVESKDHEISQTARMAINELRKKAAALSN